MKQTDCVLGIDMGTGGARVGIFDLNGNPIVFCSESYPLYTPTSGRAEQNPDEWWEAICKASRRAIAESDIDPHCIKGMSVDTTCSQYFFLAMTWFRYAMQFCGWMFVHPSRQRKFTNPGMTH